MSMSASTASGRAIAAINVTPMADIMIVLLIIFMVITPLLDGGGVKLPSTSNATERRPGTDSIVISIRADTSVLLGDERLDNLGELALGLHERLATRPAGGRVLFLRADEALPYSAVQDVLEICRQAGADEVALMSQKRVEI
jgi:biopolymer transport protein ExbD